MLQAFEPFKLTYISRLKDSKLRYLVSQSYSRAFDHFADEHKIDILLSAYADPGAANIHLNAIKKDKYAAILDLQNAKHKTKLEEMLAAGSAYKVFFAMVKSQKELKEKLDRFYKDHIKRFITKRTSWRIGGDHTIFPALDVTFGELFITLKYGKDVIRVKFEEIERA